ncbi:MAG: AAA family ATPase, partial [Pseudonocardia sp.]|nr:AAA family ATPase [Pseudonocardia sp.]
LDAQRYLAVRGAVQRLGPLTQQRPQLAGRLDALRAERQQLLAELADAAAADRARIATACCAAGATLQGVVRVRPVPSTDRREVLALIESIPGQRTQIRTAVQSEDFSPRSLADAARSGPDALTERFDIRGAQATSLAAAGEALFLQLEELTVPTAAQASLNVATQRGSDFRPLHDLSQGQKATALLLLLLTASHGPLIIDQPEDDLDNRFIWEGVVPRLRELKCTRQLILSTHNANIPVLGDAELVIALEVVGRKGRVIPDGAGSLDEEPVRRLAEQILEGGREAFDRRRYLYGF